MVLKSKKIMILAGLGFLASAHAYEMLPVEMIFGKEFVERAFFNPVDTIRGTIDALGRLIPRTIRRTRREQHSIYSWRIP